MIVFEFHCDGDGFQYIKTLIEVVRSTLMVVTLVVSTKAGNV